MRRNTAPLQGPPYTLHDIGYSISLATLTQAKSTWGYLVKCRDMSQYCLVVWRAYMNRVQNFLKFKGDLALARRKAHRSICRNENPSKLSVTGGVNRENK